MSYCKRQLSIRLARSAANKMDQFDSVSGLNRDIVPRGPRDDFAVLFQCNPVCAQSQRSHECSDHRAVPKFFEVTF